MVSFEFIVSFSKFVIMFFGYGGELSSSTWLLVILLTSINSSNFLLLANYGVSYASLSTSKTFLGHFHSKIDLLIF
jgi:hypothetical protein